MKRARPARPLRFVRSASRAGYTAIEVMMALTIFAIGAAGVMAMQRSVIQGNDDARKVDVATSIAREWVERLRRDAMVWTLPNSSNPTANNLSKAPLFADAASFDGAWHRPIQRLGDGDTPPIFLSPGFNIVGNDVPSALLDKGPEDGGPIYCTQVRLTWLVTNEVIRAEVRVFWPRNVDVAADVGFCSKDDLPASSDPPSAATLRAYHFVYDVTSIRRNQTR